jgi:hypothetical protein
LQDWQPIHSIQYRPTTGPTIKAMRQLRCRREFDRAWSLFNIQSRRLLAVVVLQNVAIGQASEALAMSKALASQRLVEAPEALCRPWDIGERRKAA